MSSNQFETNRAMVDEDTVEQLLENLDKWMTDDERAKLQQLAVRGAALTRQMAEVGLEAARRNATSAEQEINMREAAARFYTAMLFQEMEAQAAENLIVN